MKDYLSRAFAPTFAAQIYERLEVPKSIGMGTPYKTYAEVKASRIKFYQVAGIMPLRTHGECGETVARIVVLVPEVWIEWPPFVSCDAEFIRREIDWHVPKDGTLCPMLHDEWKWQLDIWWQANMDINQMVQHAANWYCRNVDSLITRHLFAHRMGWTRWPKNWAQWSHGDRGVIEFQKSLAQMAHAA